MCRFVHSGCVCADGWAGVLTGSCGVFFSPQQDLRRQTHTQSLVIWQHCLQSLIIALPLGLLGGFSGEFDTISTALFFFFVDQVQVLRMNLCVSGCVSREQNNWGLVMNGERRFLRNSLDSMEA